MIGRTLATYRVLSKLGAGGMGEVYRARDEKLDRDVAVKVLPTGLLGDETARSRFRKEAKALSRFTHPHVATLLDFGSADGVDYLVMELVPGRTLAESLRNGPLPAKDVVRLGTQLARGLKAAHEQGIVHRDLKPSNLCLTGDGLLKILDFGLAQLAPAPSEANRDETPTETAAGKIVGSPPYMSPEQLLGKDVDARSDVYSAGACLYELATGRKPHGERSGASLTEAILHEAPEPASRVNADVPAGLASVIAKAMDKDPGLRYQGAGELLVDLERLQQGSEAGASREVLGRGRGGRASRLLPWAVGVGVAVVVAAAAVFFGWSTRAPRILGSRAVTRGLSTTADPGWASDGTRVYYSETRKGVTKYYQAPLAGGEPSEIPIPFPFGHILAYLPRQGALLVNGSDAGSFTQVEGPPLWLVRVPSGEVRRLGNLKAWQAAVSPDEQRLALVYRIGRVARIALAKADGSDLHELLKLPAGRKSWVSWAPDGERLRFGSTGPAGHEDEEWIWEMSVRGETPRPLWRGGAGRWTPDGRHFIFARPQGARGRSRSDLWAARDRSWLPGPRPSPVRLSFGPMSLFSPGFGPDGRQLYAWGDVLHGELLRYDAGTQRLESYLGGVSGHFADASPDAQWVAFVTYPEAELWKCRPDGSQRVQLSRPGTATAFPRWSPDGREIAFLGLEPGEERFSLRRVSAGGSGEEVLARPEPGAYFSDVCWLPEGEGLVFWRPLANQHGIFKLDLRTKQVSLLPGAGNLMQAICSRQGHVLSWQQEPKPTYRILRHGRTEWEDVGFHFLSYPNWTRDGEAIIGLKWEGLRVERFDLKNGRWTTVVDLAQTPLVMSDYGSWMGLAADDSPVVLRDRGSRDLYALDWEAP